ncbi:sensor histidine kinase [Albimonas pacifica]|uniref:Histidine kinase n=1 Tax=Albimonas pacifica TaxID=1114924 RepID=A0A1I3NJ31_9RHOB|nr:histidine kinase [Albimonas pacifica]SFJ09179.1 Histidine kinase [Albimonas pacifica]
MTIALAPSSAPPPGPAAPGPPSVEPAALLFGGLLGGPVSALRFRSAAWAAFVVFEIIVRLFIYQDLWSAVALTLALDPFVIAFAYGLSAIYRRLGFEGRLTLRSLGWILGLGAAGGVLMALGAEILRPPLRIAPLQGLILPPFLSVALYYFLAYLCWGLACFWTTAERARRAERRRAAQAEAEAREAELQRLRLQLDPHFLINALNGAAEELRVDPAAAHAMIEDLSIFLRRSLAGMDRLVAPLDEEVDALEAYLAVQRSRFGERFEASLSVDAAALGRGIASFLLQPLVENAVEHGRRGGRRSLSVAIRACGAEEDLEIVIRNPGRLADAAPAGTRSGIGLDNVRRRLALHYPGRHALALEQDGEEVRVSLRLEGAPE